MKLKDILKREKFKATVNQEIDSLKDEIKEMEFRKTLSNYDKNRTIIGEATALSDIDQETKDSIFQSLEESYEDYIIRINKDRIKLLRQRLRKQLREIF